MAAVVTLPLRHQEPVPLHEAIDDLVAAAGRVLLSDQEHVGMFPDGLQVSLTSLRRVYAVHQAARKLSDELAAETGRPTLHVVARAMASYP